MATYEELRGLFNSSALRNKVEVAIVLAAEVVRNEDGGAPNHANRLLWAADAFDPSGMAQKMLMAVLAANADKTVEQILGASDPAIQSNVEAVIDIFATGA